MRCDALLFPRAIFKNCEHVYNQPLTVNTSKAIVSNIRSVIIGLVIPTLVSTTTYRVTGDVTSATEGLDF